MQIRTHQNFAGNKKKLLSFDKLFSKLVYFGLFVFGPIFWKYFPQVKTSFFILYSLLLHAGNYQYQVHKYRLLFVLDRQYLQGINLQTVMEIVIQTLLFYMTRYNVQNTVSSARSLAKKQSKKKINARLDSKYSIDKIMKKYFDCATPCKCSSFADLYFVH